MIDTTPAFALIFVSVLPALREPDRPSGAAEEHGAPGHDPLDVPRVAELARRTGRRLDACNWLQVALIRTFGRTHGMAVVGLKVVVRDGAPLGVVRAFARVFGHNYVIRVLTTPVSVGSAQGAASIGLTLTSAAAAIADPERRTLWDRLTGTSVVRA